MPEHEPDSQSSELPTLSSSLLNLLRAMDPDGWTRLVEVFGPLVYRWCRQSGVPEGDAPDVVQEVFTSVARGIPRFERQLASGSFRSWLGTITRNCVRDHYRRANRRPIALGGTDALGQWHELPDAIEPSSSMDPICGQVSRRVLELIRAEFENPTWRAFWMTTVESRTPADVAQELGLSLDSVYQAKSRVLRRLRQRISELPE